MTGSPGAVKSRLGGNSPAIPAVHTADRRKGVPVTGEWLSASLPAGPDFFAGLDLIDPGVTPVQHWRKDSEVEGARRAAMWGGVGHQPR